MIKILIADEISLDGLKLLPANKYHVKASFGISNRDIINKFGDFDVLVIRSIRKIDRDFLSKSSFKIIATCSKGTDHIDTEFAKTKSIKVINAEDSNNISAAEHTLTLLLCIYKNIIFSDKLVRKNKFSFYGYKRNELYGKSIGIIGFGKVGSYVGKLCSAFGMNVTANDTDGAVRKKNSDFKFKSLNYILKNCEVVSIHIPLTEKNLNFISKDKLKLLKPDCVLLNTSRGKVLDEEFLYKQLKEKKIYFAGLDVMCNEPNVNRKFFDLDNVILTNHIAGKTIESRERISGNIFKSIDENFYKAGKI